MVQEHIKVKVQNVTKSFGDLLVLNDISFEVQEGEFLCVVGPTGCGKTTFLNSLIRLYDIDKGSILVDDQPVCMRKQNISYIFQEYSTMPWLTVEENIRFGLEIKRLDKKTIEEQSDRFIHMVGLDKFRNYYPSQLSAGMLQRVVIARSFCTMPELLLMDEPYGQLDIGLRYKLEDELLALWRQTGTTVIFITHNIEEAVYLGQRILVLSNKPTKIKEIKMNTMPYPRDIASEEFVALRDEVTDLIKWW